jgi:competence protein ComEC
MIYFGLCFILIILIIYRYQVFNNNFNNSELRKYRGEISLKGKIIKEPDIQDDNIKLVIEVNEEKLLATVSRYPEYEYGDELIITGELKEPVVFEGFNYLNYLKKDKIYSVMYYPQVELLSKNYDLYSYILSFKNRMRQSIYRSLSPPQSSILGAMLLGDKSNMSSDLKDNLNSSGVRHITAVSGMHIVIISSAIFSLFSLFLKRRKATIISLLSISFFIVITGFQSSSIRAGIMGSMFLIAPLFGRKSNNIRALAIAFLIMLVINPLLLIYDIGFQLSFLAVLGIIYLSNFFRFNFIPFKDVVAMSLSAYVFTLPILMYNFGRVSLVGILTNILIVPVVYSIMIFGFLFSFVGLFSSFFGLVFSFPCWLLLTYILKVINMFSWGNASISIHWVWLVFLYLFLFILISRIKFRQVKFLTG